MSNWNRGTFRCDACLNIYGARKGMRLKEQREALCPHCRTPLAKYWDELDRDHLDFMMQKARFLAIKEGIWIR